MNQQPKAYQQGWVEFYKLRFRITPDVLIPRPETELLVDEVLNFVHSSSFIVHYGKTLKKLGNNEPITNNQLTILDLGTGSGAIAISIAKNLSTCQVDTQIIASDISKKALKVAKQNAKLHGAADKIAFIQSDLLSNLCHSGKVVTATASRIKKGSWTSQDDKEPDIIVTNLPYIPTERIKILDSSVKDFEPHLALDGGKNGFELYRKLFAQIKEKHWNPQLILGEIDYTHGEIAINEASKYFPEAKIEIKKDLAHLQRIVIIKNAGESQLLQ